MRRILAFGLLLGLGVTAAVADTTGSCSIRAGRTEDKMSFNWQRGDCATEHRCNDGGSDMLWSKWSGVTPGDLQREGAAVDARMRVEPGHRPFLSGMMVVSEESLMPPISSTLLFWNAPSSFQVKSIFTRISSSL